jgi:hypothetical protein
MNAIFILTFVFFVSFVPFVENHGLRTRYRP